MSKWFILLIVFENIFKSSVETILNIVQNMILSIPSDKAVVFIDPVLRLLVDW